MQLVERRLFAFRCGMGEFTHLWIARGQLSFAQIKLWRKTLDRIADDARGVEVSTSPSTRVVRVSNGPSTVKH